MIDQESGSLGVHVDPVCGMEVHPGTSQLSSERDGRTIWFCCAGCKKAFDRKPSLYLRTAATRDEPSRVR